MTGPIFHTPGAHDLIRFAIAVGLLVVHNEILVLRFGFRLPLWTTSFTSFVAVQILNACTRDDVAIVSMMAYIIWSVTRRRGPWDDWKKKLGSKLSSLTEVVRASLKRQQAEAFG